MKSTKNGKALVLLLLAVLIVGGGAAYWQYTGMTAAEGRLRQLESEVPDEKELTSMLASSQAELAEQQAKLDHLEKSVPGVAYVPTLLRELESVGKGNKITVTGVRPVMAPPSVPGAEMGAKKAYQEIEIDITGRGSYFSVLNMVQALQKFPKIVAVNSVAMLPKREGNQDQLSLEATVRIKAFMFPNDPSPDSGDKLASNVKPAGSSL